MRRLLLVALCVLPSAGAWAATIDAPAEAGAGLPFFITVCAEAPGEGQLRVLAENATLDIREDRYLPPFVAQACRDILVTPGNGTVIVEARLRAASGGAVKARDTAHVALLEGDVVALDVSRVGALRAPLVEGWAIYPALPGLAAPARVRIVEARAPPLEGVLLANDGPGDAHLGALRLNGGGLPNVTLAPGNTTFIAMDVKVGELRLTAGARVLSQLTVPKLKPGEGTSGRYGRTHESSAPMWVPGDITLHTSGTAPVVALIDEAREEVLVEAYTLTSPRIAGALARAADRGARVRVLLEGAPVGGISADERALVATLQARGAEVSSIGGEGARYRTLHPKVVVVDRAAVSIATENLGESSSRGHGLIVRDPDLAARVAEVVEADLRGHDIRRFEPASAPGEALDAREDLTRSLTISGANVSLVLSPDDPLAIADLVRSATRSVTVEMLRAEAEGPMMDALIAAARQGAEVRVKLDGRFDDGTNRETAARLNALGIREDLSLSASLDRRDRTLHAKTITVDSRALYVGSMNWVRAAIEDNREAGLIVESPELARWLEAQYEEEKRGQAGQMTPAEVGREVAAPPVGWVFLLMMLSTRAWSRPRRRQA